MVKDVYELKKEIDSFDIEKFFSSSGSRNISKGAAGVITSRQIVLLENFNNGLTLHNDVIGNIYYVIYPKIKSIVDNNGSLERWTLICARENITIKLTNESSKIVIIEFPLLDGITLNQYNLFKQFMNLYYNQIMNNAECFYIRIGMDFYSLKSDSSEDIIPLDELYDIASSNINLEKSIMDEEVIIGIPLEEGKIYEK